MVYASSLSNVSKDAGVAVLLRTTLAVRVRTVGPGNEHTLVTEHILVSTLIELRGYAEAEALGPSHARQGYTYDRSRP